MRYVSLFSGIEAASVAWESLGFEPVAFSEIDPFACAVLAERFPDVPNLGDITQIDWSSYVGAVDIVVGGSPCQAFSVAGNRRGLMDDRSALMLEYIRAVRDLRPRWIVWENVPGVLSQAGGRAFSTLLGELEDCGYALAWRVLDAQWFGVSQRRRRVFVVGNADWRCAAGVLFERDFLRWDTRPSGEERARLADTTRCSPCGGSRSGIVSTWSIQGNVLDRKAKCNGLGVAREVAPTINTQDRHGVIYDVLAYDPNQITSKTNRSNPKFGDPSHAVPAQATPPVAVIAFSAGQSAKAGSVAAHKDVAPTLRGSASGTNQVPTICMADLSARASVDVDLCGTLKVGGDQTIVAQHSVGNDGYLTWPWVVRRLTPVECERLQGFPDGWTQIPWRGKSADTCPNSPRYVALGNSMAVPVMHWIGQRLAAFDAAYREVVDYD